MIGINSQIATAGSQGSVGIAFAVPVDTAKAIIPQLQAHQMVSHAYLGVRGADGDSLVALDDDERAGVRVEAVDAGGPAARAGILGADTVTGGDVIMAVDGTPCARWPTSTTSCRAIAPATAAPSRCCATARS